MSENSSQQLLLTIALALVVLGAAPRAWSMSQESGGMASPVPKSGALAQMSGPGASGREIGGHDMSHDMSGMDMTHMGHDMAHMHMGAPPDPAKLAADKAFSEFNHRFAGVFVLLVGALALFEPRLARRAAWVRYLWSVLFFFPGLYLFFYSDPESWPVGSQSLQYVIHSNPEVLQHKVFSLLLLGLGVVEFIRVRRNLRSLALSAVFPVLAAIGAIMLLFHAHGEMDHMDAAAHLAMLKIERQHLQFAITGFGIAISKALSDTEALLPRVMRYAFAVLMVVLGVLLINYTE